MLDAVLSWIAANQSWAYLIVGIIAFGESLAIVGLIVPGAFLLFGIGGLIGLGQLELWPSLIAAMIGAILGDGISFWLGYHFRERLAVIWPFKHYPALMKNGVRFFQKHGGKSIIFGRFVGPVRPIVPAVAGMMRMSVPKYLSINVLSAMAWSPAYIVPTALLVGYTKEQASDVTQNLIIVLLILLAIAWLVFTLLRWAIKRNPIITFAVFILGVLVAFITMPNKQTAHINAGLVLNNDLETELESYGWQKTESINGGTLLKLFDPHLEANLLPVINNTCEEAKQTWTHRTAVENYFIVMCFTDKQQRASLSAHKVLSFLSLMRVPMRDNDLPRLEEQLEEVFLATGQDFQWQNSKDGREFIIGN